MQCTDCDCTPKPCPLEVSKMGETPLTPDESKLETPVASDGTATTRLYRVLEFNKSFVSAKSYGDFLLRRQKPRPKAVVVTCMDTRLIRLLPHALNFHPGDAKIIKNAGAVITHPFGCIMRSVIVALYELNANEIFVIAHHDCGMSKINPAHTIQKMVDAGISPQTLNTLEYSGINVKRWLHGFDSVHESVRNSVAAIRNHPLVPKHVPVHGLIIDPETGALDLEVDGNLELAAMSDVDDTFRKLSMSCCDAMIATTAEAPSPSALLPAASGIWPEPTPETPSFQHMESGDGYRHSPFEEPR